MMRSRQWYTNRGSQPSLGLVIAVGMFAAATMAIPMADSLLLTHLRIGLDIFNSGHFPSRELYRYPLYGEHVTLHSWLLDIAYGAVAQWFGWKYIAVLHMIAAALIGIILARTVSIRSRTVWTLALCSALAVGALQWRPGITIIVALLLALLHAVLMRARAHLWVLVIAVVWTHVHGSFVFGALWILVVWIGDRIDKGDGCAKTSRHFIGLLFAYCFGLLLGCVGPYGPARVRDGFLAWGTQQQAMTTIDGVLATNFRTARGIALLIIVAVVVILARSWRVGWRGMVPFGVFLFLGLVAQQNLVFLPIAIAYLFSERPHLLSDESGVRAALSRRLRLGLVAVLLIATVALGTRVVSMDAFAMHGYPEQEVAWMRDHGLVGGTHRVMASRQVSSYLEFTYGNDVPVFADSRNDLIAKEVNQAYKQLRNGTRDSSEVLDEYNVDVVLWYRDSMLITVMQADPKWRTALSTDRWTVMTRNGT